MAKIVITNPQVTLAGGTVSANVAQATISIEADDVETTSFSSTGAGWRERIGGLKQATVSFDFHNDYAAGSIDSVVFPLIGGTAAVTIRPTGTAAAGSSTPEYSMVALITEYSPIDSAVGDLATFSVTWPVTGAVTRGTGA